MKVELTNRSGGLKQLKVENRIVQQYESENVVIDATSHYQTSTFRSCLLKPNKKNLFYIKPKDVAPKAAKNHLPHGSATFLLGTMMKAMSIKTLVWEAV